MASGRAEPVVSVVSPFYDRAAYLPSVILTLQAQSFRDVELVIADDASRDGLAGAVEKIDAGFPVRYVRLASNRGAASARNAGIDAARGRYIALLDSDDGWHPDKLLLQLRHLEAAETPGRLVSLTRQVVKGRRSHVAPSCLMTPADDVGDYLFRQGGIIQSSMMMLSRNLAAEVRFEEGSRGHDDWSFALRLQSAGARFEMLPEPLTIYDDGTGRMRRSPSYSAARLQWLQQRRAEIGEAAYWAAVAAVASHLPKTSAANPLRLIATAHGNGAVGLPRTAYYMLSWAFPPARSLARSAFAAWAGRPSARTSRLPAAQRRNGADE
ncbi:glycosyltransferase family 2 protein [Aestuariivirga sp.]|uniref:glycosyltransferase family 2 protein n=1 Tax=Aestuariivirga sp. TaxID=2650926 RepID=UPI003918F8A1